MSPQDAFARFEHDPLAFLDEQLAQARSVAPVGRNRYLLADPLAARAVLRNSEGRYHEHSDFFHTRFGLFGPREAQLTIRRGARELLRNHLQSQGQVGLEAHLGAHLPRTSAWPDTGNHLAYGFLRPLLLTPDSPRKLNRVLDQIVKCAVLAGARARQSRWRRMLLQFQTTLHLSRALEARRAEPRSSPLDLLDVIAAAARPEHRLDQLSEVFLSFLFAIAGSVGFVLAWSIYLLGTHPKRDVPPEWVVQEALRLWPVAWLLGRNPSTAHQLGGVEVNAGDDVVVCPYSVQRHPDYWTDPAAFRPERWSDERQWRNAAFIPFGHGPHRCVAADLSSQWVSDMLRILNRDYTLHVAASGSRPTVAAAMAPPPFTLSLTPRE